MQVLSYIYCNCSYRMMQKKKNMKMYSMSILRNVMCPSLLYTAKKLPFNVHLSLPVLVVFQLFIYLRTEVDTSIPVEMVVIMFLNLSGLGSKTSGFSYLPRTFWSWADFIGDPLSAFALWNDCNV